MSGGIESVVGALKDFKGAQRTAGNLSINSTTWVDVDTATDLVLTAAAGDVLEVGASAFFGNENAEIQLDAVTMVSGSAVRSVTGSTDFTNEGGVQAWRTAQTGVYDTAGGSVLYTVQSGDISNGAVTLRLRSRTFTGTRIIRATSDNRLDFWAKNLGQVGGWSALVLSGLWVPYTPTLTASTTNPVLGTGGAAEGEYTRIGDTIEGWATFKFGSSGASFGAGDWRVSLPVAPKLPTITNAMQAVGSVLLLDYGTAHWTAGAYIGPGFGSYLQMRPNNSGWDVYASAPFTWAINDALSVEFKYRAAS